MMKRFIIVEINRLTEIYMHLIWLVLCVGKYKRCQVQEMIQFRMFQCEKKAEKYSFITGMAQIIYWI